MFLQIFNVFCAVFFPPPIQRIVFKGSAGDYLTLQTKYSNRGF